MVSSALSIEGDLLKFGDGRARLNCRCWTNGRCTGGAARLREVRDRRHATYESSTCAGPSVGPARTGLAALRRVLPLRGMSPDGVVALQAAANNLGLAQAELARSATVGPEPALDRGDSPRRDDLAERMTAEAAAVLALAETTIDSAVSRADQAERWLRLLRQHGRVGAALEALSVRESQLITRAEPPANRAHLAGDVSAVASVTDNAANFARQRGAAAVSTVDVLFAVMACYGQLYLIVPSTEPTSAAKR